jgi:hypothetical protein
LAEVDLHRQLSFRAAIEKKCDRNLNIIIIMAIIIVVVISDVAEFIYSFLVSEAENFVCLGRRRV